MRPRIPVKEVGDALPAGNLVYLQLLGNVEHHSLKQKMVITVSKSVPADRFQCRIILDSQTYAEHDNFEVTNEAKQVNYELLTRFAVPSEFISKVSPPVSQSVM